MPDLSHNEAFRQALERNVGAIGGSAVFLNLYSPDMSEFLSDPWPAIQLAIAILMDKPIILGVLTGREPPERLRRLADHVVIGTAEEIAAGVRQFMGPPRA